MAVEDLSAVYNQHHYKWDGSSRPNIADYTAPWQNYASKVDARWNTSSWRKYQEAVNYARDNLKIAESQYNADLDYWNELDSRDYNDPVSQTNRYQEAGYNLGYLYGSVESGNTSSGYAGSPSDMGDFGSDAPEKGIEDAVQVVSGALRVVTDLAKTGIDLAKMPSEIALNKVRYYDGEESVNLKRLERNWLTFLRGITPDGKEDTSDYAHSFAFALEQGKLGQVQLSNNQLTSFLKYCDKIYENQSTDISKDLMQDVDSIISDVKSPAVKAILRLLAIMAMSDAKK